MKQWSNKCYTHACSCNSLQKSAVLRQNVWKVPKSYPLCHLVAEPRTTWSCKPTQVTFSAFSPQPRLCWDVRLKSRQCGNFFCFVDALKVLSGFEFVSINLVCVLREEFISGIPVRWIYWSCWGWDNFCNQLIYVTNVFIKY